MQIEPLTVDHWPRVREIYLAGIRTGIATFETSAPDWDEWDKAHHAFARLVLSAHNEVIGWAALSRASNRSVYAGVSEVSIYISPEHRGRGCGHILMNALVEKSEQNGIWTLQACVFPENQASINLHRNHGFRVVGQRERIAKLNGTWRSTVIMERRSEAVGTD
ncbi:MAG: N-acetyltransferase family protein [Pyrinomonadaceae bacterium]